MGIRYLWIGPLHTQTVIEYAGTKNNHGYWPKHHNDIDPAWGSKEELKSLAKAAKAHGMELMLEAARGTQSSSETTQTWKAVAC